MTRGGPPLRLVLALHSMVSRFSCEGGVCQRDAQAWPVFGVYAKAVCELIENLLLH